MKLVYLCIMCILTNLDPPQKKCAHYTRQYMILENPKEEQRGRGKSQFKRIRLAPLRGKTNAQNLKQTELDREGLEGNGKRGQSSRPSEATVRMP